MILDLGRDGDLLSLKDRGDPLGGPAAFGSVIDTGQRLQSYGRGGVVGQGAAEIMPVAAHGQRRRADRAAKIESEDLGAGIAPKLQGHECQQHRLAGAGRPDDQSVPDVADM